tara:strand:+ start:80 stop:1582 length:1503 start_codon:yes stop_codon:yes gene_type:complete
MKTYLKLTLTGIAVVIGLILLSFFVMVALPVSDPLTTNASSSVAITNVTVINPGTDTTLRGQTVLIEDKRITYAGDKADARIPKSAEHIDGTGKYLIPGLWDMHTHWGSKFAPQLTMPLFIANGITNIRDLGGSASLEKKNEWRQKILKGDLLGPRSIGQANLFIGRLETQEQGRKLLQTTPFDEPDFIKVYNSVLPDPFFSLMDEANKLGVKVLGHKPRAVSAIDASNAGYVSFEHARLFLFECYPGAPELRAAYLTRYTNEKESSGHVVTPTRLREMIDQHDSVMCNELMKTMVGNGTWFVPTHLTRKMDAFADNDSYRQDERLKYIHFAQRMLWTLDANDMIYIDSSAEGRQVYMDFYLKGLKLTGVAHRAGVQILAGSDANDTYSFPGMGLHDELQELVLAGLSPMEALKTATFNAADYFNLTKDYGSIEAGKVADMVLLNANPLEDISNTIRINRLVFNGAVYDRSDLNNMLDYVEKNASSLPLAAKFIADLVID